MFYILTILDREKEVSASSPFQARFMTPGKFLDIYWKKANTPGFIAGVLVGVFTRVVLAGILEGWGFETLMYPVQW